MLIFGYLSSFMKRILITGATGNVGLAVVRALYGQEGVEILAEMRDRAKDVSMLLTYPRVRLVLFNVAEPSTQDAALAGCNALFLLRPPYSVNSIPTEGPRKAVKGIS